MTEVIIIIRETGRLKPDYSLKFDLPAIPAAGHYISISRQGEAEPWGEDLVVRKVWWRLKHPETEGFSTGQEKVGSVTEIYVECDVAEGPWSSDQWMKVVKGARSRGVEVESFDVERLAIRPSELSGQ